MSFGWLAAGLAAMVLAVMGQVWAEPGYHLVSAVKLPGAAPAWDYLALDPKRPYLLIGRRKDGEQVYDLTRGAVVKRIAQSEGANAARLAPQFDRGYTANEDGSTTVFRLSNLTTLGRVKLGESVDSVFFEPVTGQMVFTLGDSRELAFLDARTAGPTGRTRIDSAELEAIEADGRGFIYVNERDRNQIAKVNARTYRVVAEWPVAGCVEPTGMAIDARSKRLFIGCRGDHPVLAVMDCDTGQEVARLAIGRGNDGVVFDAGAHRVFTANGGDANIVVVDQRGPDDYRFAGAFTTRPYARTLALDPMSHKIYTVTAEGVTDPGLPVNPHGGEFYPNRYLDGSFTVLTYAPDK